MIQIYKKQDIHYDREAVAGLIERIDAVLKSSFKGTDVFVKMSSRSPKDSTM